MNEEEETFDLTKELRKARTMEFSLSEDFKAPEGADVIEPSLDAKTYDMDGVTDTIKVEGFELKEPPKPAKDAERKALERADPTADYKRNREAYGVMCPVCKGSGKCVACKGRRRRYLVLKCKECMGTGVCQYCDRDLEVACPQCGEAVSKFASTCTKCGLLLTCPVCGSPLPAMATICMMCQAEFRCRNCDKPYPRQFSWRCPHCGHWNE
ncbi:MAG: hypothetical protein JW939_01495 [Candidatus Thermoplasmatota archaeon]|nr:hypothetical protein [Candidatus Thermoplasmatota archaeon]